MNYLPILIASLAAAPALAGTPAQVPAPEPSIVAVLPVSTGTDWTGFYVGASAGSVNSETLFVFVPGTVSSEGLVYGGHMGYNYDLGNFVIGAEYEYSVGDDGSSSFYSVESISSIKGRIGYDAGSVLIYGVVGYSDIVLAGIVSDVNVDGVTYGAGADYRLTDSWSIGAEYMTFSSDDVGGASSTMDLQTLKARVSYSF